MKINGVKYLNSNFYDSIMIRNDNKSYIKVDVKSKFRYNGFQSKKTFTDNIKELSEKDKINEIIRYYLRYSKINSLADKCIDFYDGEFIAVEGSRNLFIQLTEDKVDKSIVNEIIKKYIRDRYNFLYEYKDVKNIAIYSSNESSFHYYKKNDLFCNEQPNIDLSLKTKDNVLMKFEEKFFIEYMKEKINNVDTRINYGYYYYNNDKAYLERNFGDWSGYYIRSNDFNIRLDELLFYKMLYIINEHNNKIESSKKLQLTLDDYK